MAKDLDWSVLVDALPLLAAWPETLRAKVSIHHINKGDHIFRRGDRPRAMFAVAAGEVRLVRTSTGGNAIVLQRARKGLLAEGSLDQPRYHCDAVAVMSTDLVSIPRSDFRAALADDTFRQRWLAELLRELRRVRAQTERLSLHSARERIIHYIEAEGDDGRVVLTQTKKDWAAELGLTHEALYRALAQLTRSGELHVSVQTIALSAAPDCT